MPFQKIPSLSINTRIGRIQFKQLTLAVFFYVKGAVQNNISLYGRGGPFEKEAQIPQLSDG